jgi:4-hydroxy-3-methylbut-2-en-1-yl diphosphate synthase IspG/GcpE
MEFVRICEDHGFHDIVISMKASNPQVMVQAYRLLMQDMQQRNMVYPTHLGVTEAGEGEDGRIKSALGISTLCSMASETPCGCRSPRSPSTKCPLRSFWSIMQ